MTKKIKQADGSYCYSGPNCKRHGGKSLPVAFKIDPVAPYREVKEELKSKPNKPEEKVKPVRNLPVFNREGIDPAELKHKINRLFEDEENNGDK